MNTICNQVRFEIDEKDLDQSLSAGAMEHLRSCDECREFQNKETKLRQIVGSLETVNAPADFDFRLRARLANERTVASYLSMSSVRVWRMRSAAVAAMLLIFAATVYMIRQNQPVQQPTPPTQAKNTDNVAPPANLTTLPTTPLAAAENPKRSELAADLNKPSRHRALTDVSKRPIATRDAADTVAPVLTVDQTFSLGVAQPSFKVSLDDVNGSARTISVPAVSFGSRRVLNNNATPIQYAPKADW